MADRKFNSDQRSRPAFTRSADGRLRPAGQESDIGDVWAEQRRIRLAEAIEQDKVKAAKKQHKGRFFSRRSGTGIKSPEKPHTNQSKEIALTISLPKLPQLPKISPSVLYKKLPKVSKKPLLLGGIALLAVASLGTYALVTNKRPGTNESGNNAAGVLSANSRRVETPPYNTILPKGKDIRELGGWGRVSPPDKDPAFAYTDKIGNIQIRVSEQPVPESFKTDIDGETGKLAKQFNATNKLGAADGAPAYLGSTAHNGPQSAIVVKHNLLVLIQSDSRIPDPQWVAYIDSLQ